MISTSLDKNVRVFLKIAGSVICALAAFIVLGSTEVLSAEQIYTVETKLSANAVHPGSTIQAACIVTIKDGWHVNSHSPTMDYLIGTSFDIQQNNEFILADIRYPKGTLSTLGFADQPIDLYEGTVTIFASIMVSEKIHPGVDTLLGHLTAQACNNQMCRAPATLDVPIVLHIVDAHETTMPQNNALFAQYRPAETAGSQENSLSKTYAESGSLLTFAAIFLIGLALNLTPCVYPMLSVTVSLFGTQTETRTAVVIVKAVVYVLGMASMYSVLGISAAFGGGLFGSWLQSPWVLGGIAALLLIMALSSFGLYQIQLPYWLTARLGGTTGTGIVAIYVSGLVVGVFAAPCVGPPVIALLTFVASKGDPLFGFWIFFTLAIGLGFPYLILGIFSGLLKKIPRSGPWLVWVERIFGVILAAAALFYLSLAVAPKFSAYIIPIAFTGGGIYLGFIDTSGKEKRTLRNIQRSFGIVTIAAGLFFANNLRETGIAWNQYSDTALLNAQDNNVPVLLDFYADWCIPCLELDRRTWTDAEVMAATKDVVKLKVDLTHFDSPESEALRKRFAISGVPTVIILQPNGKEAADGRFVGFFPPKEFMEKFQKAIQKN